MFCMQRYTPVAPTLVARGLETTLMLADAVKCVITQRTGLVVSGAARPTQTHKPKSTELYIGGQPIKHSQLIRGYPCVIIGCNPRRFLEVLGTVDTRSRLQNPQDVPVRDSLTILPPTSLPQMSGKTLETGGKTRQDARTFKNDSNFWAPKVAKRPRDLVGHNIHKFRIVRENVEFVGMPKILSRVDFDAIPICFR